MADRTDYWQVRLIDDMAADLVWVTSFQPLGPGGPGRTVAGFEDDGRPKMLRLDAGALHPPDARFAIPYGLAWAIAETLKPGPSAGEVKRLEQALEVERRRVDQALDRRPHTIFVGPDSTAVEIAPREART